MTVAVGCHKYGNDGSLLTSPRLVDLANEWHVGGWAVSQDGLSFVSELGASAVPSTAMYIAGLAFTQDGALYVTDQSPAATVQKISGLAVRQDGAVHVRYTLPTTLYMLNGFNCDETGVAFLAGIPASGLVLWVRQGMGITESGGFVSQWADQSGLSHHLKQATATNQPALNSDGSVTFDGVDNNLKAETFVLAQPETAFFAGRTVTWTSNDRVMDGNTLNSGGMIQRTATPQLGLIGSAAMGNISPTLDTDVVISAVWNGASSLIALNAGADVTGNVGTGDMSGLTLGATGAPGNFGNIRARALALYSGALSAALRARCVRFQAAMHDISL